MGEPERIRRAARAVVLDDDRRILLVHFDFAVPLDGDGARGRTDGTQTWDGMWACPGGGLDAGESVADGLRRELVEELGLVVDDVGEPVWVKEHRFPMSRWDGQYDTYFLIEVPEVFDPRPSLTQAELLREHVDAMRWWEYDSLMEAQRAYDEGAIDDEAFAVFSPRRLGHHLTALLENGRPTEPLVVGPH
jgi:8-oxo-dGTP pyrophosphatase MutT (NUDIX family)